MDKKFIAAIVVCVMALTVVATGTYFIGQKGQRNVVRGPCGRFRKLLWNGKK